MSAENFDEVILEVQGTLIRCDKKELIENSDYFRAMLEGNFVERNQSSITISGVDLGAMNIILTLLWDETYDIDDEHILSVLQAACMLQFDKIKDMCIVKLTEMLSPKNCLKIWQTAESLSLKPLYLKAKLLALEEFVAIKDTNCFLYFTLEEICNYLGNIYLKTDSELSVFQAAMRWWCDNYEQCCRNPTSILFKLLSCIDYHSISDSFFNEFVIYPDIAHNSEIFETLDCLRHNKNGDTASAFPKEIQEKAELLYKSKSRISAKNACFLVSALQETREPENTNLPEEHQKFIIYHDKFKRRRVYEVLSDSHRSGQLTGSYYDDDSKQFRSAFKLDGPKCDGLEGFKILGRRELVFLFGGQYLIGRGNWNCNFWVYDSLREKWKIKSVLPFRRRHFESCMAGSKIFIAGGTGSYRITQENTFWYDYEQDLWCEERPIPFYDRQLKCCCFEDRFFLFSITRKCGYFYVDSVLAPWEEVDVTVDDAVLSNQSEFAVFSYKDKLYIKGKDLIELTHVGNSLVGGSVKQITNMDCDKMEVTLCNNLVYTYYRCKCEDVNDKYSLEVYNMETGEINFIFQDLLKDSVLEVDDELYLVGSTLKLFSFHNHQAVEINKLVNDSF